MREKDLRILVISWQRVHGRTIHRVATRRIPAVGPIKGPIGEVEVQIDWLRQVFIKKVNVSTMRGSLTLRDLDVSPRDSALTGVVRPFLGPIKLAAFGVHGDADTPFPRVRSGAWIPVARVHESFDFRPIQVCPHPPTAFPL